jgi:Fe-Mn family superoxide dismutase
MSKQNGPFQLPALPWTENALAPVISADTIGFHYGKHHQGYVSKLNAAADGGDWADLDLEGVIRHCQGKPELAGVFNNAAQVWNHTFYWESLTPGGESPSGELAERLDEDFGGLEAFQEAFGKAAARQFGSGWAWLVDDGGKLRITTTSNADTPLTDGHRCLLTIDVWEHAYYLDYQNRRPAYLDAVMGLLDWKRAAERQAQG